MTFSIIQKSQLEGAKRLDAEYYQPEYLEIKNLVSKGSLNTKPLRGLVSRKVVTGSTPTIREPKGDGTDIYFIKTDTVRDGKIVFEEADRLPAKQNIENSTPKGGDVLVTIIGATFDIVGRSAMVFPHYPKMNINQNVALIRPSQEILSGYLEAFLRGKYGRRQLWQQSRQTEQVNLNCREVENILVPVPARAFQQEVEKLVQESHASIGQSITIYNAAENLLLEELGLRDFKADEDLYSVVNFSDIRSVGRMDADYFQPKYERLLKRLKQSKLLLNFAKRVKRRAEIVPQREYNYIEISDVNAGSGEVTSNRVLGKELPANAKIKIEGGELLVSKVRSTRGAVSMVPADWKKDFIASGAFSVFDAPSPVREYLQVVLRSPVGKIQMERPATGTSYPTITDEDVEDVMIPVLSDAKQQKIAELVCESHTARKKAKELLEEAKRKVEELIESNAK